MGEVLALLQKAAPHPLCCAASHLHQAAEQPFCSGVSRKVHVFVGEAGPFQGVKPQAHCS